MTECQGCGAWNDRRRTFCVLCGTPLAEADEWDAAAELPPLPPLPDGGLSVTMPAWLRAAPTDTPPPQPTASTEAPPEPALGAQADPRTFLRDEDFPRWIRELPALPPRPAPPAPALITMEHSRPAPHPPTALPPPAPLPVDHAVPTAPPGQVASAQPVAPVAEPVAAAALRDAPPARPRAAWETALLVLLGVGVVAAVLWALVANGLLAGSL